MGRRKRLWNARDGSSFLQPILPSLRASGAQTYDSRETTFMVSLGRWRRAQQYERAYWAKTAEAIAHGATAQLDWYQWRANQLKLRLDRLGMGTLTDGTAAIIEVGSGPIGVAGFFPARERVLVDPLEGFYGSNPVLSALRNPAADYRTGGGESLPVADAHYDMAIIENCIDHVQHDDAVYRELHRVLRPDAILYLTVNCRTPTGFLVHRTLSRLRLDPGHPHTYTPEKLRAKHRQHAFEPVDLAAGSYAEARAEDLRSPHRHARLKAYLGISEYLASVVARRAGS